jgi:hypothetical protein
VAKIEAENRSLRLDKDQHKRVRELEEEIESLKAHITQNKFSNSQMN